MKTYPTHNCTDEKCAVSVGVLLLFAQPNQVELGVKLAIDYINKQNMSVAANCIVCTTGYAG